MSHYNYIVIGALALAITGCGGGGGGGGGTSAVEDDNTVVSVPTPDNTIPTGNDTDDDTSTGTSTVTDATQSSPGANPLEGTWELCSGLIISRVFSGNIVTQYQDVDLDQTICAAGPRPAAAVTNGVRVGSTPFELLEEITTDSGLTARKFNFVGLDGTIGVRTIVFFGTPNELLFGDDLGPLDEEGRPTSLKFNSVWFRLQ